MEKTQAVFLCAMREIAAVSHSRLGEQCSGALPVLSQFASITKGTIWVLNRERFNSFAPNVDVGLLQTLLDDA